MKKIFFLMVVGFLFLVYACGGGNSDPRSVIKDYINVMENFTTEAEKCNNADDVVAAINKFTEGMKRIAPRIKAMAEKHPELKNLKDGNLPKEYKDLEKKVKELIPRLMGAFGKIAQYASDPKVIEAQKKMQEAMTAFK